MELNDVIGPAYPCKNCSNVFFQHALLSEKKLCPSGKTEFEPERISMLFNLPKFSGTPLSDIASRLKAL